MEELKEFISKFADLFDNVDADSLSGDTEFRYLDEWSSLSALSVIAMIDEEYGISVSSLEIRKAATLSDLFELVKSKK